VSHADVARYSPPLAGKLAASTDEGITGLTEKIVRAIVAGSPSTEPASQIPIAPTEKWVDVNYPRDSGLVAQHEAAGYQVRWCADLGVARALDIEGWEYAYQDLGGGRLAILRLQDGPYNQTLIRRRRAS
jgi:hypothetical protein